MSTPLSLCCPIHCTCLVFESCGSSDRDLEREYFPNLQLHRLTPFPIVKSSRSVTKRWELVIKGVKCP